MNTTSLADVVAANFVLVSVTVRSRAFKRTDHELAAELSAQKAADADAVDVHRNLFVGAGAELKKLRSAGAACRTVAYGFGQPFANGLGSLNTGDRMVATVDLMDCLGVVGEAIAKHDAAREEFKNVYSLRVQQAIANSGNINASVADYPDVSEIDNMFSVSVSVKPIPTVGNLPAAVPTDAVPMLTSALNREMADVVNNAAGCAVETFTDVLDTISGITRKLLDEERTAVHGNLFDRARRAGNTLIGLAQAAGRGDIEQPTGLVLSQMRDIDPTTMKNSSSLAQHIHDVCQSAADTLRRVSPVEVELDDGSGPPHPAVIDAAVEANAPSCAEVPAASPAGADPGYLLTVQEEQDALTASVDDALASMEIPDDEDMFL